MNIYNVIAYAMRSANGDEYKGDTSDQKLRREELLELLQPTGLKIGLAHWWAERKIRQLRLLLLDL